MKTRHFCWLAGVAVLAACLVPLTVRVVRLITYAQDRNAANELICQLGDRRPPNVDAETWEMASTWASIAYVNVCCCYEQVSHEELRRFRADLEKKVQGPVDLATIDWLWNRLGQTGPHGRNYQERFEPQYRENLEAMRRRR